MRREAFFIPMNSITSTEHLHTQFSVCCLFILTAKLFTFQIIRCTAVFPQFLKKQTQNRRRSPAVLPAHGALIVQKDRARLAPSHELLLILVVGNDSPDRYVSLSEPPEHQPRNGQVYGGLYMG